MTRGVLKEGIERGVREGTEKGVRETAEAVAKKSCRRLGSKVVGLGLKYGDDAVRLIGRYGDDGVTFLTRHGSQGLNLVRFYGDDAAKVMIRYGDDAVGLVAKYGDDGVQVLNRMDDKTAGYFAKMMPVLRQKKVLGRAVRELGENGEKITRADIFVRAVKVSPYAALSGVIVYGGVGTVNKVGDTVDTIMGNEELRHEAYWRVFGAVLFVVGLLCSSRLLRVWLEHRREMKKIVHRQKKQDVSGKIGDVSL